MGVDSSTGGQCLSSLPPIGVNLQPQLASMTFATNNPTLTTVALEKPLCMFDSAATLNGTYEIYLYVLVNLGEGLLPLGGAEGGFGLSAGRWRGGSSGDTLALSFSYPRGPHRRPPVPAVCQPWAACYRHTSVLALGEMSGRWRSKDSASH